MAVPFRRTSKTRKRKRRTHFKLALTGIGRCSNPECNEITKSHRACPSCGTYKGKTVIEK